MSTVTGITNVRCTFEMSTVAGITNPRCTSVGIFENIKQISRLFVCQQALSYVMIHRGNHTKLIYEKCFRNSDPEL